MAKSFRRFGVITVVAVYLLILVGAVVRSTESGMGCPDWPKCFGQWVPPTSANQLPEGYEEHYVEQRREKNERVAKLFALLGFQELSEQISNDPKTYESTVFNAIETWIEYINRLLGVLIGLFVLATFVLSLTYWKSHREITLMSFLGLFLVIVQAVIGAVVVSTNLLGSMITIHLTVALVIVGVLIYAVYRSYVVSGKIELAKDRWLNPQQIRRLKKLLFLGMVLYAAQFILGAQVRDMVDAISETLGKARRDEWIENLDLSFYVHRSFSLVVLVVHLGLIYFLQKFEGKTGNIRYWTYVLVGILILEILSGAAMAYFAIPAFIQPIHLILASLAFGA
ncbi:MAG: COX15/CtaA family protein, partial [Bacteroidota bacterium]